MAPFCGALLSWFSAACEMPLAGKWEKRLDFNRKRSEVTNVFSLFATMWKCFDGHFLWLLWWGHFLTWLVFITTAVSCWPDLHSLYLGSYGCFYKPGHYAAICWAVYWSYKKYVGKTLSSSRVGDKWSTASLLRNLWLFPQENRLRQGMLWAALSPSPGS